MLLLCLVAICGLMLLIECVVNNSKWHRKKVAKAHKEANKQVDIFKKRAKKYAERQASLLEPDE